MTIQLTDERMQHRTSIGLPIYISKQIKKALLLIQYIFEIVLCPILPTPDLGK